MKGLIKFLAKDEKRALEDLNPRHQVLETCVLPTELRAHVFILAGRR
jgi:hypothetical protein